MENVCSGSCLLTISCRCRSTKYLEELCRGFLRQTNDPEAVQGKPGDEQSKAKRSYKTDSTGNSSSPDVTSSTGGTMSK
ncbi:hypothetical protein ANCDUO_03257 [Ancylostoma duodenale]|uniref:Uncharacterized protein n=1 Tax=Ancylostoma duodenale TaxID=51022 RepID=A0A0C2H4F3_9BILA|nr:hypothetical protein ANCDUO_03257 [Ancylostoma duodenale]